MRVVAIPIITSVIAPPQKPACENTYGRPRIPAPITVPISKAIAVSCGMRLFFLDFFHEHLLQFRIYNKLIGKYLNRVQKKADKVEEKMGSWGYFALAVFVGIPLPGTGAWTGTFILWLLDLERKKAIPAVALGVTIAAVIILFATLGILEII